MWSRVPNTVLRGARPCSHRTVIFSRRYNTANGPPKTYFQTPPQQPPTRLRSRFLRSLALGTTSFIIGFYVHAYVSAKVGVQGLIGTLSDPEDTLPVLAHALQAGMVESQAKDVHPLTVELATSVLESQAAFSVTPTAVGHICQSPSNLPCEDTWSSATYSYLNDPKRDWSEWAIFDGHAGPRTSEALKDLLPAIVGEKLWQGGCMTRLYTPNDVHVSRVLQNAFKYLDDMITTKVTRELLEGTMRRAEIVSLISNMLSGSCALMALFDPAKGVLRVACTGDSRAVLGRWEDGKYVARAMSEDQTGFNKSEVERLKREHPGEDVVDPATGRVFGLAVTRAFGDSRWKWTEELTRKAHEMFWGPAPRPNGVIKTPPYLTAEPEVQETKVQTGEHPDFLILASDGLWDLMSNEHAVECVQLWLEQNNPTDFLQKMQDAAAGERTGPTGFKAFQKPSPAPPANRSPWSLSSLFSSPSTSQPTSSLPPPSPFSTPDTEPDDDEDTFYDPVEKTLKWRVEPKHFVVEDEHVGVHLVKNAFGGKRRRLFEGVMSVQPPLSRNVRDDITVMVIFFGVEAGEEAELNGRGSEQGMGRSGME